MGTVENSEFVEELWAIIAEELSHLRDKNRMMHGLFCGELERDRMKLWAKQLFLLTRTGPRFLSSIHSNFGMATRSAYAATKGAVNAATRALAVEIAPGPDNIGIASGVTAMSSLAVPAAVSSRVSCTRDRCARNMSSAMSNSTMPPAI